MQFSGSGRFPSTGTRSLDLNNFPAPHAVYLPLGQGQLLLLVVKPNPRQMTGGSRESHRYSKNSSDAIGIKQHQSVVAIDI